MRTGEEAGYDAVFLPEIAGRDALVTLGALAGETSTLRLATGILPMDSRNLLLTAMAAATVQERSGGRAILGLGTGPAVPGALERLGSRVRSIRALLAGETVEHEGRRLSLSLDPGSAVPIWIAALGPRAVRLGGEVADGIILNWCTPERVADARRELTSAAEQVGRDPSKIRIAVYVRASPTDGPAPDSLRAAASEYASFPAYARQFQAMGLATEAAAAAAAGRSGRPEEVPEELLRRVCLVGDARASRSRLQDYREAGADLPVVYPVSGEAGDRAPLEATLAALGPV